MNASERPRPHSCQHPDCGDHCDRDQPPAPSSVPGEGLLELAGNSGRETPTDTAAALAELVQAVEAVGDDQRYWPREMRLDGTHHRVEAALDSALAVLAGSTPAGDDIPTGCDYCGRVEGHSPRCGNPAVISNHVHGIEMGDPPGGDTETPGHHHGPRGLAECPTCSPPPGGDDDTETLRATCTCYPGGFSPETYEGPQEWCEVHGEWRERLIAQRDEARAEVASLSARLDTATAENERLRELADDYMGDLAHKIKERDAALAENQRLDRALDEEIGNRDRLNDLLDQLAYTIAPQSEIGEHSSHNDPWANALEIAATLRAARDAAVAQVAAAQALCERWESGYERVHHRGYIADLRAALNTGNTT